MQPATPMGGRTLRDWLLRPLVGLDAMTQRHDVVQAFWFPALNTAIMMALVLTLQAVFFPEPSAVSFLVLLGAGVLAYLGAVILSTRVFGYASPTDLLNRIRRAVAT